MAKKKSEEVVLEETSSEPTFNIAPLDVSFGSEDLNKLASKVNEIINFLNK